MVKMSVKTFDLNIGEILEHWSLPLAIREIIANSIDETALSKCSKDMEIKKLDELSYVIRDYGRGIRYENLVQDESKEKLKNTSVIGKFGFGLKDAIATFIRNNINFKIKSKHNLITVKKSAKHNFEDIKTLHAFVDTDVEKDFEGTEIILYDLKDDDMEKAKNFFLKYNTLKLLETTKFGELYESKTKKSMIFMNGIKIAEEPNFLFHYNITSITPKMRKSLNRERTNVGRALYSKRIQDILQKCTSDDILSKLVNDISNIERGVHHDEITFEAVKVYAIRHYNTNNRCIFLTKDELVRNPDIMNDCNKNGKKIIIVSNKTIGSLSNKTDVMGNPINTLTTFLSETVVPKGIIDIKTLEGDIKENFLKTESILNMAGYHKRFPLYIVKGFDTKYSFNIAGLYHNGSVYILKDELISLTRYAGTLIHEYIHATTHTCDSTRDFETHLTDMIGMLTSKLIK